MFNLDRIEKIYLALGVTDLRKSIDGLSIMIAEEYNLDVYDNAMFVFCNRAKDKIKIINWDNGFWLYYYRIEKGKLKWPNNEHETLTIDIEEFKWILKGYEPRIDNKFSIKKGSNYY